MTLFPALAIRKAYVVAVNLVGGRGPRGVRAMIEPTTPGRSEVVDPRARVSRPRGSIDAVLRGVSFTIERGRSYGLVGESGCGKSTAALAIVRYLPRNGRCVRADPVAGRDVSRSRGAALRDYHARRVDGLPEPRSGAEPEHARRRPGRGGVHRRSAVRREASDRALEALGRCRSRTRLGHGALPAPALGRMQQRVVIAMALAKDPALLILDEPTTGLDATVEAEVLDLVAQLQAEFTRRCSSSATTSA
jgi:peptide/nickel transport system ATP-binding protein